MAARLCSTTPASAETVAHHPHARRNGGRQRYRPRTAGGQRAFLSSHSERDSYAARLEELLAGLEWAGFDLPEAWDTDFDPEQGVQLFAILWRGDVRWLFSTALIKVFWLCSPSRT
ncbi:hypothetical protein [Streptomyces sp. NPDC050388]|uniref:hypothetical protein n=1 Tax=Streptomyces sp. NPDC050388 TaxID=3155781 RepID=UPI00344105C9